MTKAVQVRNAGLDIFRPQAGLEERFANRIREERAAGQGGAGLWPRLSVTGGQFMFMDKRIGDEVEGIVLAVTNEHKYYTTEYDPSNVSPADCAAVGDDPAEMRPDPKCSSPQSDTCETCVQNAWKSDPRGGRGKACTQRKRMIFLPWDGSMKSLEKASGVRFTVSVTNSRHLKEAKDTLEAFGRPLCYTRVKITVEPDKKNQYVLAFYPLEPINDLKVIDLIDVKIAQGNESLRVSPIFEDAQQQQQAKKGKPKAGAKGRRKVSVKA